MSTSSSVSVSLQRGERRDVVLHAGRRLGVHDREQPRARGARAARRAARCGSRVAAPGRLDAHDVGAAAARDLAHPLAEDAVDADDRRVARLEQVDEARLHARRTGAADRKVSVFVGAEHECAAAPAISSSTARNSGSRCPSTGAGALVDLGIRVRGARPEQQPIRPGHDRRSYGPTRRATAYRRRLTRRDQLVPVLEQQPTHGRAGDPAASAAGDVSAAARRDAGDVGVGQVGMPARPAASCTACRGVVAPARRGGCQPCAAQQLCRCAIVARHQSTSSQICVGVRRGRDAMQTSSTLIAGERRVEAVGPTSAARRCPSTALSARVRAKSVDFGSQAEAAGEPVEDVGLRDEQLVEARVPQDADTSDDRATDDHVDPPGSSPGLCRRCAERLGARGCGRRPRPRRG